MRRTPGASASRRCGRVCAIPLIAGMLLATPGLAVAQPGSPDSLGTLVAAVANVNQKLQDLGAAIQAQQEGVNKAIVDVQAARDNAAAAQRELDASGQRVKDANTAIAAAQDRFDTFAVATYVNGPSSSYLTASDPSDILNTAATGQTLAVSTQQVISDLQRARTEQVNKESAARLAKQNADQAVIDAEASQQTAVSALTDAQQTFGAQQAELDKLTAERAAAQAKLDAGSRLVGAGGGTTCRSARRGGHAGAAPRTTGIAPPARRHLRRASGPRDCGIRPCPRFPARSSAAIRSRSSTRSSATPRPRRRSPRTWVATSCRSSGLLPTPTGYTNGAIPRVYGRQATEYVIQRAMAQRGRAVLVGRR